MRHSCGVNQRREQELEQKDWDRLKEAAVEVMGRAYAPYSHYKVGAAALADDGRTVVGCNVENAAYGVVLCAECGVVSQLHATGGGRLTHFVCVNGDGDVIMPCGRCRQLLFEHGGRDLLVWTVSGIRPMSEVLPDAFGPDDLATVAPAATIATATEEQGTR
jgi:cytidine deaminase